MKKDDQEHEKENQTHEVKQDQPKSSDHPKDEAAKAHDQSKESAQTAALDHKQLDDFSQKMDSDDDMRSKFQVDPHGTLKAHGVALPEGYKAAYDHQYVKSSDGANRVSHSYGPVRISK